MERLHHRATSLALLLAEIHQRELLAEAERDRRQRAATRGRTFLALSIPERRPPG